MNVEPSSGHPPPSRNASIMEGDHEKEEEEEEEEEGGFIREEEQDTKIRSSSYRLMLPSDGYEWKKYGQKFIKHIGKFRSYFKCQRIECGAKKTAEWCKSEPNNIKVVYNGHHSHHSSSSSSQGIINSTNTASATNSYNLFTQVFGEHHHHHLSSNSTTTINHDGPK